jgi:hypothetical protein
MGLLGLLKDFECTRGIDQKHLSSLRDLRALTAFYPAMNRWAILFRPCSGLEGDLPLPLLRFRKRKRGKDVASDPR